MKCISPNSILVHLQQGKVLIVWIKCVSMNINCISLKLSLHDTNIMHSIMAYIKRVYLSQA